MFYNARWYDPTLGRFAQADSIVPGGVQGLDRYAYVNNNPLRYNDPTGHMCSDPDDETGFCEGSANVKTKIGDSMVAGNGIQRSNGRPPATPCIICHTELPTKTIPETTLSDGGYINPELELLVDFWETIGSPMSDGLDMHEAYVISSSKWYKTPVWSLPTSGVEAVVAGYRQYYRDSWWESYTPVQRSARVLIATGEAYAIDKAASAAGSVASSAGAFTLGPVGATASFGTTSYATSQAGYDLAASINKWVFPNFGLGLY